IFIFKRMCKMCITSRYLFCSLLLSLILITSLNAQDLKNNQLTQQYYEQGEVEKAQSIYEKLAKNRQNIPFIHRSYLELLLNKQAFKQAEAYIKQLQKWFPENIYYDVDEGIIYRSAKNQKKADDIFDATIKEASSKSVLTRALAQYFFQNGFHDYAIKAYLTGRKVSGNNIEYAMELANVYRRTNNTEGMIEEYLNYIHENPSNIGYVQNVMQNLLTETEDLESLETLLYDKIQSSPNNVVYNEL